MKKNNKGFTLIELLIVVAIIAILAAIAIPNFLAAQVRAKVSRSKNDLRTIATALESYMIDNNTYPINPTAGRSGYFGYDGVFVDYTFIVTTPIAYITNYPKDPFAVGVSIPADGVGYFFYTYEEVNWTPAATFGSAKHFAILSFGPDLMPEGAMPVPTTGATPWTSERLTGSDILTWARAYDPTNGTVSYGEIYRTQLSGQID